MDVDTERMCKGCHGCQVVGKYSPPEPMQRTEPPTGPWQDVAADLMDQCPAERTCESKLTVIVAITRW